jgi:hypothetical protein
MPGQENVEKREGAVDTNEKAGLNNPTVIAG